MELLSDVMLGRICAATGARAVLRAESIQRLWSGYGEISRLWLDTWTHWKIIDGNVALQDGMSWTKLDFQRRYPPNPSSLTFDDTYEHFSGTTLGETSAFTQQSVRMFADRKMIWGSVSGVISPDTTIGSIPPDRRGSYLIDGYTIQFTWDDGKTTKSSFVWNESDPRAIFIAGAGYTLID